MLPVKFLNDSFFNELSGVNEGIAVCLKCDKAFLSMKNTCGCSKFCNKKIREKRRKLRIRHSREVFGINVYSALYRFGNLCSDCGIVTTMPDNIPKATDCSLEHKIPLYKGGKHSWDNVEILCRSCNSKRNDKDRT